MTIETSLVTALSATFGNRFYPDTAPIGVDLPFCTFQQVGGQPHNYIDGVPTAHNARIQFNVWAATRNEANTKMRALDAIVRASPFYAASLGDLIATYEETTTTYGAQQDFSFWHVP